MKPSIIIRVHNEERWIGACLRAVFAQRHRDFEVVVVDNKSTDRTRDLVAAYPVKLVGIDEYLPGKALNVGIRVSTGDAIVCLSGHCVPVDTDWLGNLLRNFADPEVAGVYGRQRPMSFSSDADKRDLIIVFGLDRRVQRKDSFFHNANSAIRRELWEQVPFDEQISHIEDRLWAKEMQRRGFAIAYDPDAAVYHHHGIHQERDEDRCRGVVRILERIEGEDAPTAPPESKLDATVIIPVRGAVQDLGGRPLLSYTIEHAKSARHVREIVVTTDSEEVAALAPRLGATRTLIRPAELSGEFVGVDEVLRYTVDKLERDGLYSEYVVLMEVTYPFRPPGLIDAVLAWLWRNGYDSVLPARAEYKSAWRLDRDRLVRLDEGFMPREYKSPIYIGLRGLGFVTRPMFVRQGDSLGRTTGLFEIEDPTCALEVRDAMGLATAEALLQGRRVEDMDLALRGAAEPEGKTIARAGRTVAAASRR